ncbi:MAG: aspartate/glutamate racemase family protein [Pseudomonadota bacterium]
MTKPLHIGLIGGIGVAATLVYYQRLTAAVTKMGAQLECTIVHAQVDDLVRTNTNDLRQEQAEIYAPLIDRLKAAGADCAAITSLGGHFCFEETKPLSALPLVSAVAPLDDYFASEGLASVGILGTRVVQRTAFYGHLKKTRAVTLDDEIDEIGQTYTDMAIAGHCSEDQRAFFFGAAQRLTDAGADAVVLGGTDLNLAFDGRPTPYRVIDALDIHVDVLARLATGQLSLAEASD